MEKEKRKPKNILSSLLGLPEDTNVKFTFNPYDNSIMKIAWNSPNDGKSNLFNLLMNPREITTLRIEDNH
jgi:hypothetical protein